jgi:hypothetical protein
LKIIQENNIEVSEYKLTKEILKIGEELDTRKYQKWLRALAIGFLAQKASTSNGRGRVYL